MSTSARREQCLLRIACELKNPIEDDPEGRENALVCVKEYGFSDDRVYDFLILKSSHLTETINYRSGNLRTSKPSVVVEAKMPRCLLSVFQIETNGILEGTF